jgi:hypothetical protein
MSPDAGAVETTRQAIGLWTELGAAYDAIERRLGSGAWDGFDALAQQVAELAGRLQPLVTAIAARRAEHPTPAAELAALWHRLDETVKALARRQQQLQRAAIAARDTTAARLARARTARARAAGYTPLNPLSPRITSRRV